MGTPSFRLALVLVAASLVAAGCSESSTTTPTAPDGSPLEFVGTVTHMGRSSHDIVLDDDSLLSITLADLDVLLFDITQGGSIANISVGLGLGQRTEEDECGLTANFVVREGQLSIFRLSRGAYCLTMFDPGFLPEDAIISYRLTLEITN